MTDLDHMEQVARAATEGPWESVVEYDPLVPDDPAYWEVVSPSHIIVADIGASMTKAECQATATHIATFDPPTVLELIATLRTQAAQIQAVRDQIQHQLNIAEDLNSSDPVAARYAAAYAIQIALERIPDTTGDTP